MRIQISIRMIIRVGVGITLSLLFASSIQEFSGYDNFLRSSEIHNLSITADGTVKLGPELSLLYNTGESSVWALVSDRKGNIFAGTGSDGKIFRIKGGKAELFFDAEETEILSLALDRQDNLYAGTAPKGIVYKISPIGKAMKFFETDETYIFALVFDDKGFLYIGTGDKGNIYRVDAQGKGRLIYDSPESHITSLAYSSKPKSILFAGSSGQGLVYKISNLEDKPEVMTIYDASEEEIRALLIHDKGDIYCGANPGYSKPGPQKLDISDVAKPVGLVPKIYQLTADGLVKQFWSSSDSVIFALYSYGNEILAGTGNTGRIYQLDKEATGKGLGTLFLTTSEPQITTFSSGPAGSILIGTGNPGQVYLLKSNLNKEGRIISKPFDSKTQSEWGKLSSETEMPSGTSIEFQTRSGNSENPDETWSQFSSITDKSDIKSPSARFLQWQATFASNANTKTPALASVKISFLETNLAPVVYSVEVMKEGSDSEEPLKPKGLSLRRQDRKITWTAFDPNGDSLTFDLYYKGIEEKDWKLLKSNLRDKSYILDGEILPDGKYQIKIVASDKPNQPLGLELTGVRISDWFEIDNTPPKVTKIAAKLKPRQKYLITFAVSDQNSIIKSCEYSINASDWRALSPSDKIFDTKTENFAFEIELSPGENVIVMRAADVLMNVGSDKIIINVKGE
ncbi:MAG: hypothetical protein OEZ20_01365 [candidate division WOR-3 bacterium]|nr:hypothetical protein [candidate division WOR-3 bacterium]